MTPDNIAVLVIAIASLITAFGFGFKQITSAINSWVETRNKVQVTNSENERLKAEAAARDSDAENEQQSKIISIMERQTEYSHETASRFATIAEDFATYQNRSIEVNEGVARGLSAMAAENKALRISFEQWPSAIDGKLETVDSTLGNLVKKVAAVETAIATGNSEHTEIKAILRDDVLRGIEKIVAIIDGPTPPRPPDSATSKTGSLTMADAGTHDAVKPDRDELRPTG